MHPGRSLARVSGLSLASLRVVLLACVLSAMALSACAPDPTAVLAQARAALQAGELVSAESASRAVLHEQPSTSAAAVQAALLLAETLTAQGRYREAEPVLERAQAAGASDADWLPRQAELLLARRQGAEWIARHAAGVLEEPAAAVPVLVAQAQAWLEVGDVPRGLAAVAEALRLRPTDGAALVMRARLSLAQGQPARARATLEDLLLKRPDDPAAWVLQGDRLLDQALALDGRPSKAEALDAAERAYDKALQLRLNARAAHIGRLLLHWQRGNLDGVRRDLPILVARWPLHPDTAFHQALLALHEGDAAAALTILEAARERAGDAVERLMLTARAHDLRGERPAALEALEQAVAIEPQAPQPRRRLASLRLAPGVHDDAQAPRPQFSAADLPPVPGRRELQLAWPADPASRPSAR